MEVAEETGDVNYFIVMKHVCKFCHKRFPCGRSLGGHMRSHLITNPADHDSTAKGKVNTAMDKKKKIQSDQDPNQIKCCKECGKAFHSSKALSGHMKSHAVLREKEKVIKESSLLVDQTERMVVVKEQMIERESDTEVEGEAQGSNYRPRRSNRRQRYTNDVITTCSSSVSEINHHEQEEVAMCLIMLSRDMGPWGRIGCELSDNNSVFLEPKARTRVIEETGENKGLKVLKLVGESSCSKDLIADEFLAFGYQKNFEKSVLAMSNDLGSSKRKAKYEVLDSEKKSKFECTTCNKTFHSYQALGGHRASHKKTKGCSPLKPDGTHIGETEDIAEVSAHMTQKHECPICYKEFPSGQALGGHKRSHLMANSSQSPLETNNKFISVEKSNATTTTTTSSHEVRDFLDLNLPAPVEEDSDLVGFKPWWVESSHKHEQLVGLISN